MTTTYMILVNWNGHRDTIECLESLLRLDEDDWAAVIVDNGSVDGSVEAIRQWAMGAPERFTGPVWADMPAERRHAPDLVEVGAGAGPAPESRGGKIMLIEAGANLGFAAASNLAMRFSARDPACRYLWLVNNDTVVRHDALTHLLAHADAYPEQAIIGATLLHYYHPEKVQALGGWAWPSRALAGHIGAGLNADALPSRAEVEARLAYVIGASMFLRRDLFDAIGGLSEKYFLYFEEYDLAKRLPATMRQGVCLDAVLYHKEGSTIGSNSLDRPSDTGIYYLTASMLRFFWRHQRRYFPVAAARVGWDVLLALRRGDRAAARAITQAFRDVVVGRMRRGRYGSEDFRERPPKG